MTAEGGSSDRTSGAVPRRGLFARLSGAPRPGELESIAIHLNDILNTRLGEALAAPDYGIVDFADVVHNFPEATKVLVQSIRATILKYEPRLRSVTVQPVKSPDVLGLTFEISGRLASGSSRAPFRIRTELTSSGKMQVGA